MVADPAAQCILFIGDENTHAALLRRSVSHTLMLQPLLVLARKEFLQLKKRQSVAAVDHLLAEAPFTAKSAGELKDTDFAQINAHALVGIWGALETCLEDTLMNIFKEDSNCTARLALAGVKTGQSPSSDAEFRAIYRRVERHFAIPDDIVSTYERMLNFFDLSATSPEIHRVLVRANAIRNCIMHRGGTIDDRAARQAPELEAHTGKKYAISTQEYAEIFSAVAKWTQNLLSSVMNSRYCLAVSRAGS